MNDIIGFAAILGAGFYAGYQVGGQRNFSGWDFLLIAFLLGLGFFFAVVLS